jgi:hypothetical protein
MNSENEPSFAHIDGKLHVAVKMHTWPSYTNSERTDMEVWKEENPVLVAYNPSKEVTR